MQLKDNLKKRFVVNNWEKGHIYIHIKNSPAFISKEACILDCDKITEVLYLFEWLFIYLFPN